MKKIAVRLVLLGAGLAVLGAVGLAQTASKAAGHWQGKIQMPERELGITVDLGTSPKGVWIGSMSVLGSTAVDVPLSNISVEDTAVRFTASLPEQASFDGHLSADASSLSGKAANAAGEAEFQLTRNGEANVKVPPPSSPLSKEFEGTWEGTLDDGGKVLRVVLKLSPAADGTATATLISVDEGNKEIPVTTVTLKEKQLQLEARAVSGTYSGTLGANGEIAGEWVKRTNRLPLTFKRVSSEAKKPQGWNDQHDMRPFQEIGLQAPDKLELHNVKAETVTYLGRAAVRITDVGAANLDDASRLAIIRGTSFQDGTIEVNLSGDTAPDARPELRGFVGISFRVSLDRSHFECFYLRPKNGRSDDQLQRNHSVQYISVPGFPWQKLRSESPGKYESYVDLVPGQWTQVKVQVSGASARLYVNGAGQPTLIVNDLKQPPVKGTVALWVGPGTIAHFSDLKVAP